jgi:hypothetical protein
MRGVDDAVGFDALEDFEQFRRLNGCDRSIPETRDYRLVDLVVVSLPRGRCWCLVRINSHSSAMAMNVLAAASHSAGSTPCRRIVEVLVGFRGRFGGPDSGFV